jgi:hypothetical protein
MKYKEMDIDTAEDIAKMASAFYKSDYPLCDNHIHSDHVQYVYKACYFYDKLKKELKKEKKDGQESRTKNEPTIG